MALLWADNFQQYGTNTANMLNGLYAEVNGTCALVADPDPTAGGTTVLRLRDNQATSIDRWGSYVRRVLTTPVDTVGTMWRWWLSQLPNSTSQFPQMVWVDQDNVEQVSMVVSPTGTIKVYRGNPWSTNTLLGETAPVVVANAWQHIEAKVKVHASAGTVEIRVDRVTVLSLTGQNTQNTSRTTVACMAPGYGESGNTHQTLSWVAYIKDWAIWDTTGSLNNDFLGSCFVYSMRPDSDVSGTWSIFGGAGSAFASINETNPDDDTKYIYSGWPAATADVCTLTDLPVDATVVKGMMAMVRSKKSDGGDGNLQVSLVSGTNTVNGSDRAITTAYTYWTDIFETDPDTSAAWTVAAANACKIKFNRTL